MPQGALQPPPPPRPAAGLSLSQLDNAAAPSKRDQQSYRPQGQAGEVSDAVGQINHFFRGGEDVLLAAGGNMSANALRLAMMSTETPSPPLGLEAAHLHQLSQMVLPSGAGNTSATSEEAVSLLSAQEFTEPRDILAACQVFYQTYHPGELGIQLDHKGGNEVDVVCSSVEQAHAFRRRQKQQASAATASGAAAGYLGDRDPCDRHVPCALRIAFRKGQSGKWRVAQVQEGPKRGSNAAVWQHTPDCSAFGRQGTKLRQSDLVDNPAVLELLRAAPEATTKAVIDHVMVSYRDQITLGGLPCVVLGCAMP